MSGICSVHQHYEKGCPQCELMSYVEYYEDVIYPEIARKDFEREIYKQMDEEDR